EKEGRLPVDSGSSAAGDVVEHERAKAALAERRPDLCRIQIELPCHREQVLLREAVAAGKQQRMSLPEASTGGGKLGKLRGLIGARVKLGIRKVAPDQPQGLVAIQQRHHRTARGEAVRATEVSVSDQGKLGF